MDTVATWIVEHVPKTILDFSEHMMQGTAMPVLRVRRHKCFRVGHYSLVDDSITQGIRVGWITLITVIGSGLMACTVFPLRRREEREAE